MNKTFKEILDTEDKSLDELIFLTMKLSEVKGYEYVKAGLEEVARDLNAKNDPDTELFIAILKHQDAKKGTQK